MERVKPADPYLSIVPEKVGQGPFITFEGGYHGQNSWLKTKDTLETGNLDIHTWNKAVGERISKYKPRLLAIDSLVPTFSNTENKDLSLIGKQRVWTWLPSSPRKINDKGEVVVVLGDSQDFDAATELAKKMGISLPQETFTKIDNDLDTYIKKVGEDLARDGTATVLSGLLLAVATASLSTVPKDQMTRRKFLKLGTAVAVGSPFFPLVRRGATLTATYSSNNDVGNIAEYVMGLVKPRFIKDAMANGRTAMLISKCMHAMNQGLVPSNSYGSVVMGNYHGFEARNYLFNKGERQKAMETYTEGVVSYLQQILQAFPQINSKEARAKLKEYLSMGDMVVVTDPGVDRAGNAQDEINKHVKYVGTFYDPDVIQAVDAAFKKIPG